MKFVTPHLSVRFTFLIHLLIGLSPIFFISCTAEDKGFTPEPLCDDTFVFCGLVGYADYNELKDKCECICTSAFYKPNEKTGVCECDKIVPCLENEVRITNCDCVPTGLGFKPNIPNKIRSDDYFPLIYPSTYIYDVLDSLGTPISKWGIITVDTSTLYFLDEESDQISSTQFYYHQYIIPDSNGILYDTVPGYALHNLIDDPNVVGRAQSMDESFPFAYHEITFEDSILFDGDYTYFDSVGTLELPAGSFERCVYARDDSNSGGVYAPNVGLVQLIFEGQLVMELASHSGNCGTDSIEITETMIDGTQVVASGHIDISSHVEANANVSIQAGNYIQLNPGFNVPAGSEVSLIIESCDVVASN